MFQCYISAFSYCSWGSQGKNTEVVCHSLLQWTTFCQTMTHLRLSTRPVPLGLLYTTWPIASLSYTRLWSMWSFWLVFYDGGFHSVGHETVVLASSVFPLMDEDKRLVQASWWEGLAVFHRENWGLALVGWAMLSKSLIQFSVPCYLPGAKLWWR